jgi:hypothetical protein
VPWGSTAVPSSLLAVIPPQQRVMLSTMPARLDVRLSRPYLSSLRWPPDISAGDSVSTTTTMARSARRIRSRLADVGWLVEVAVLTQRPTTGTVGSAWGAFDTHPAIDVAADEMTTGTTPVPEDDSSWDRFVLGSGTAVTTADVVVDNPPSLWRFGLILDFAEAEAAVTSDQEGVTEFLGSDVGKALLAQALVPLRARYGVRLSPPIAPAGALTTAAVARTELPAFEVEDLLLVDGRGGPVLCLCAQLAGSNAGVKSRVQLLLAGQDFAYAVSEDVMRPAYEVCWTALTRGATFVGETPVELPVGDDPNVTETGRAQMLTTFSPTLDDVAIKATAQGHGDAVRLLVTQNVQLLRLWDHDGKEIKDLGDLAKPAAEPTILPISIFESNGGSPDSMNPNFKDLLLKLLIIQVFPTLEPFPARMRSVTGYCSGAMKTVLVRWSLVIWRDDLVAPNSGLVMGPG